MNTSAWDSKIGPRFFLLVSRAEVMIDRDSWGQSYLTVGGETLTFVKQTIANACAKDVLRDQVRKLGIEDYQIPS